MLPSFNPLTRAEAGIVHVKKEDIFRGSGGMPLEKSWKSRLQFVQFEAFWRQI